MLQHTIVHVGGHGPAVQGGAPLCIDLQRCSRRHPCGPCVSPTMLASTRGGVACTGAEKNLSDCSNDWRAFCGHQTDVGIECGTPAGACAHVGCSWACKPGLVCPLSSIARLAWFALQTASARSQVLASWQSRPLCSLHCHSRAPVLHPASQPLLRVLPHRRGIWSARPRVPGRRRDHLQGEPMAESA